MAYQANIPNATDRISASQADIQGNFQELLSWGNGYGNFTAQGAAPTFAAGNDGIYTLPYATTGVNELFVHKQVFGGTSEIPFTASKLSYTAIAGSDNGW